MMVEKEASFDWMEILGNRPSKSWSSVCQLRS